jgi:hypothetical protein
LEIEASNTINYLDVSIRRTDTNLKFHIFRKPTFTDTIIPHDLCHPPEQKHAALRYLYNRVYAYDLDEEAKTNEINTILNIMHKNKYPPQPFKFTLKDSNLNSTFTKTKTQEHTWVTFTYTGKETRLVTQLFRNTNLKISYRTNNTIE